MFQTEEQEQEAAVYLRVKTGTGAQPRRIEKNVRSEQKSQ